jgi:hypothetical protein
MAEHRQVPEPDETIYLPRPSWAPLFFALGALGLVCGIYASGFALSPYVYAVIGGIFALAAFRSMARGAIRDFYRLPRKQRSRSAALPIETIPGPPVKKG